MFGSEVDIPSNPPLTPNLNPNTPYRTPTSTSTSALTPSYLCSNPLGPVPPPGAISLMVAWRWAARSWKVRARGSVCRKISPSWWVGMGVGVSGSGVRSQRSRGVRRFNLERDGSQAEDVWGRMWSPP